MTESPTLPSDTTLMVDGFEVLDACHRQILFTLGKLAALVSRLHKHGADAHSRAMAQEIAQFFSSVAHRHHEDEERHVFPTLLASGKRDLVQDVLRLQQDHLWIEQDWLELRPQLEAVAAGNEGVDLDLLGETTKVFTELLHDHIALEETCIYPEARARTAGRERRQMGREMAERRRAPRTT